MVSKGRHPKSAVAAALDGAKNAGLDIVEIHKGRRWGKVACDSRGLDQSIWSTPKNEDDHAKQIAKFIAKHSH